MKKINWSIVMLGFSLATLSVLTFHTQQATAKHRATALGLLGDYADFAVFNFGGRIHPELERVAMQAIEPMHSKRAGAAYVQLGLPAAASRDCGCGDPMVEAESYFLYSPADQTVRSTVPLTDETASRIREQVRLYQDSSRLLRRVVLRRLTGLNQMVAFRSVRNGGADPEIFGGIIEASQIANMIETTICRGNLLPESLTRGVATDSLINLAVFLPGARTAVFSSMPNPTWLEAREDTLPQYLGGIVLRGAIREDLAPRLIIGGLPRSRLPMLLALLLISAGLAVLAIVQMRRERALVRMRENFVTSVSHELRTPLSQMQLYVDTIRMGRTSNAAERDWAMSHIARETTRLSHLVENVLHISKPKRATPVAAPVIDVSAEISDAVDSFEPLARSRRARLVTSLAVDALVAMRREHLRQVLLNLLDNAVKYGPPGQQVTVESRSFDDTVEIAVSDEGPGVLGAERERIWEPYFRGSTPEAVASGGTGIGLSIVRDLVKQYGGSVDLASSERGARFVVRLQRVRVGPRNITTDALAHSG